MSASSTAQRPRVLLVDDHPAVLRQAAALLADEFVVVGALPDGRTVPDTIRAGHPEVVVLDITLPDACGIELARQLACGAPAPKIVMLTVHADPDYVRAAFAAGALGYVVKSRLACDLIPALHAVLGGRSFISPVPSLEEPAGPQEAMAARTCAGFRPLSTATDKQT
ncbi:MAG TPA: response regulator transcription factor [Verrucomicrobiota bacterium]|nr:response regulator transcription factor [Verrucomicrobiota bacterium]